MKQCIILIVGFLAFSIDGCSQNKSSSVQSGAFICRINKYIVFRANENNDGEYQQYSLKAIDSDTKGIITLDANFSSDCVRISDTTIAYIKGKNVILWDSFLKKKTPYLTAEQGCELIGLGINQKKGSLLIVQVNYTSYELFIRVLNARNKVTTFQQKIKLNDAELEGVCPHIATVDNYFIFSIQDKLYSINLAKPVLNLISTSCDAFALNNSGVIYYKFVTDESTQGYYLQLLNWQTSKIDNLLNEKIYNCEKSSLLTTRIEDNFVPCYIICGVPYFYSESRWITPSNVTVFRDKMLLVELPVINKKVNESSFTRKLID